MERVEVSKSGLVKLNRIDSMNRQDTSMMNVNKRNVFNVHMACVLRGESWRKAI